jgi:predicted transcriptional regulator
MKFNNNDTMTSFRLPIDVDKKMDWVAEQRWTDKSSIYRDAVRKYLVDPDVQEYFTDDYIALNEHLRPTFS